MSAIKTETLEEYMARGGSITICKPGRERYDHSAKYRKDSQLNALKALKKQEGLSEHEVEKIDEAIMTRIQILKVTL